MSTAITDQTVMRACPEAVVCCLACTCAYLPTRWGRETCSLRCYYVLRARRERARNRLATYWRAAGAAA